MAKPDDIPQGVWDTACDEALLYVQWLVPGPEEYAQAEYVLAQTFARAIMAAKAEEREACAELCGGLRHRDQNSETEDWVEGTFACQAAIRKRGEA